MTHILIEAKNEKQAEFVFLDTYLDFLGLRDLCCIYPLNGWGNLKNTKSLLESIAFQGEKALIIFDADSAANGGGFQQRIEDIRKILTPELAELPIFLWPNQQDDGDVETLLEQLAQREKHRIFFDCFEDYEKCVQQGYRVPNRKGKLFTYMSAQPHLTKKQRDALGSGQWLFDNADYWDLQASCLEPLKAFLLHHVQ